MQLYYHYTSLEAFKSIVESKSIWLSNASFLNDSTEIINGKTFLKEITDITLKELTLKNVKDFLEQLMKDITNPFDNFDMYIASFSKEKDKKSQWVEYAPCGLAIAFDSSAFPLDHTNIYQVNDCLYTHEEKRNAIIELITDDIVMTKCLNLDNKRFNWEKEWGEEWNKLLIIAAKEVIKKNKKIDLIKRLGVDFEKELLFAKIIMYAQFKSLALISRFKDEGFKEENETRFVRIIGKDEVDKISFRVKDGKFIPYTTMPIELSSIKQIIIGPMIDDFSVASIKQFTVKNKIECEFIKSKIPLQ